MNTVEFLNIAAAICPDRNAIVFEGERWTFKHLDERVNRLANALKTLGIQRGDCIGMLHVNCPQYLEVYFAAAKTGAIFVPLNFKAKPDELIYMINNAGIVSLFAGDRYLDMLKGILPELPSVKVCISIDSKKSNGHYYDNLIRSAGLDEFSAVTGDEDVTVLLYTAGTTGRPKGVPLSHNGFVSHILENIDPPNPEIEEQNLLTVPLYHIAGMQAMLSAVYGGRTLVLMRQFEVEEWMKTVQAEQATRAMLVPTMLKWIIDSPHFHDYNLSSLRVITYGAAPMPFEVIKKAIRKLPNVQFINAFGQTETASTITALGPEDHVIKGTKKEKEIKLKRLASSIGKPLSDVEVRIVDKEGKHLPAKEMGEIMAKGPRIMTGYWGDEQKTAQVITRDGWLRTGDKGWMDEDGYIYLVGRSDDIIIRGGENISPEEVEDVLYSHPAIEEAAVIGVPDKEWGRQPRAIVVLKSGKQATGKEIMEYCRSRLASFKRPRSVVFVGSLPRNSMQKVLRKLLRKEFGQS